MRIGGSPRAAAPAIALGATAAAVLAGLAAWQLGALVVLAAIALAVVVVVLLNDARAALLAAVLAFVGLESQPEWGVPAMARLYEPIGGGASCVELVLALAVAATLLELARRGEGARLPAGFCGPLALALAAVAFALVNGRLGGHGQSFAQLTFVRSIVPLFVFPLLIVNVLRTPEQLRGALGVGGALAIVKAIAGLAVALLGISSFTDEGPALTYYAPAANWLLLLMLLTLIAAWLGHVDIPRWAAWGVVVAGPCLLLSYRRTFWLAFVLCLLIIVPVASGRAGRRLLVPAVVLVAIAGWLVLQAGFARELQGPLVQRAKSIDPAAVSRNDQDRYRLAERRNVLEELRRHPLAGIGAGVDWHARYPLNFEYQFGRDYVHLSALWWWLKGGVIGLGAYLWLLLSVVVSGFMIWRRHRDRVIAAAALAAGVGTIGLAAVELASSVVGADQRGTAAFAIVIGLLAVARGQLASQETPAPEATIRQ